MPVQAPLRWFAVAGEPSHHLSVNATGDFPPVAPYQLGRRSSRRAGYPPGSRISQTDSGWYRTVYRLSISDGLRLCLRPD